jgi:DNA-binding winged helix-turn-helix (wHTH) protein/predicted ATPase
LVKPSCADCDTEAADMPMRTFRFSAFTLDVENGCLLRDGARLALSPKDFALLYQLVAHRQRVLSHAELLQTVWRETTVGADVLKARIRRLRRILGDDASAPRFIASVHGEGYRFVAPVRGTPFGAMEQAEPAAAPAPLIGREVELASLHDRLGEAAGGRRTIAFVSGEPGIGKTALLDAFAARARSAAPLVWVGRGQCIEHYGQGEPYLPVLEALGRLARTDAHEQLAAALRQYGPSWLLDLPSMLEPTERQALQQQALAPSPERRLRELTEALEVLTTERVAGRDPPLLVLVLEDLHWADPSTIELLALLARRSDRARLLVVGSHRALAPEHPLRSLLPELRMHAASSELRLPPLLEVDVARYLDVRFPGNGFSARLAPPLHQCTGGNPLFFTDVTRDLLAHEMLVRTEEGWAFHGSLDAVRTSIPTSFRHLVEKQRDESSGDQQRLLEAASVAGLEFSAATLGAALGRGTAEIEEQAAQLAVRERFLRESGTEEWPDGTRAARFAFLHALHRELWYERTPASRREQWHLRIAERKEAAYGSRASEIAAELALHFEEAREFPRAISCHEQAGTQAFRRAANVEARAHLSRAFELLRELPDTPDRMRQELPLQIRLGTLIALTEGYTSAGTARAFRRAHEICRQLGDAPDLFDSVAGLFRFFLTQEPGVGRELAEQLAQIAEQTGDPIRLMGARLGLGQALVFGGAPAEGLAHAARGLELSRTHWSDALLPVYGVDVRRNCAGTMADALQLLGYPDQASRACEELLEGIDDETHPFVSVNAHWGAGYFHQLRGDTARVREHAEAVLRRNGPFGPPEFGHVAEVWTGWALIALGEPALGMSRMQSGAAALRAAGVGLFEPYVLGLMADGHRRMGQRELGRATIAEALAAARRIGPAFYDAELHRLDGELRPDAADAEACFTEALAVARRQQARSWELRAALSLGELWRHQGRRNEARALVSEVFGWFTEGFDTPDLKQAQAFLAA